MAMRWHSTLNAALQFDCCIGEPFRGAAQEDAKGNEGLFAQREAGW